MRGNRGVDMGGELDVINSLDSDGDKDVDRDADEDLDDYRNV